MREYSTSPSATNFFCVEGGRLAATCEFPYLGTEDSRVTLSPGRQFGRYPLGPSTII